MRFDYELYEPPDGEYGSLNDKLEWTGVMKELVERVKSYISLKLSWYIHRDLEEHNSFCAHSELGRSRKKVVVKPPQNIKDNTLFHIKLYNKMISQPDCLSLCLPVLLKSIPACRHRCRSHPGDGRERGRGGLQRSLLRHGGHDHPDATAKRSDLPLQVLERVGRHGLGVHRSGLLRYQVNQFFNWNWCSNYYKRNDWIMKEHQWSSFPFIAIHIWKNFFAFLFF